MISGHNILEDTRREFERNEPIFLISDDHMGYQKWISDKPIIFKGVRGSGKTSILKALDWEIAWKQSEVKLFPENDSLNLESKPGFIGIYIRGEKNQLQHWEAYYKSNKNNKYIVDIFSTYFEWVLIEKLSDAIHLLFEKELLTPDRDKEFIFISELSKILFKESENQGLFEPSFFELKNHLFKSHSRLRKYMITGMAPEKLFNIIPILQYGELLEKFTSMLKRYFPYFESSSIFILIDDYHRFLTWQQELINTLILTKPNNISFKLSFLEGTVITRSTFDPIRPLGENDLETISFGDETKSDKETGNSQSKSSNSISKEVFIRLINGIIKTRYFNFYNKKLENFSIEEILKLDTNIHQKVFKYLDDSISKSFNIYIDDFKKTTAKKKFLEFLIDSKLPLKYKKEITSHKSEKKKQDKFYNKRYLSIALNVCNNYPYSGFNEIYGIAGSSIRSFLKILNSIAEFSSEDSISDFLKLDRIPIDIQSQGIKSLSDKFMLSLDNYAHLNTNKLTEKELCKRFGSIFQSFYSTDSIWISPECNAFKIKNINNNTINNKIIQFLLLSGTLRKSISGDYTYLFLNPILAPHFNLTYRKPFTYYYQISDKELGEILTTDNINFKKIKDKIYNKRLKKHPNLEFDFSED